MPTYRDELNKQLAQEIAAIDEQLAPPAEDVAESIVVSVGEWLRSIAQGRRSVAHPTRPTARRKAAAGAQPELVNATLQRRRAFLTSMQEHLEADPALLSFVDAMIGNQVKAAERRQPMVAAGVSLASLIAGWLLSAISPVSTLTHLLAR